MKIVDKEMSSNINENIKLILNYAIDNKALFSIDNKNYSVTTKVFLNQIEIIFKTLNNEDFSICFAKNKKESFLYIQNEKKITFTKMKFKTNHSNINKYKYWYINIFEENGEAKTNNIFQTFIFKDYDKNMDKLNNKINKVFKILDLLINKDINEKIEGFITNINLENEKKYLQLIKNNKDNLKDFLNIHNKVLELGFCPYNLNKEEIEIILLQTDDHLEKLKIEKNVFKKIGSFLKNKINK